MDLVHKHKIHTQHPEWYEAKGLPRPSFRKGQITLVLRDERQAGDYVGAGHRGFGQDVRQSTADPEAGLYDCVRTPVHAVQDGAGARGGRLGLPALADFDGRAGALLRGDHVHAGA